MLGEEIQGRGTLAVSRYPYREARGLQALEHLSADLELAGRVSGGRFWVASLPPQDWLQLDGDTAAISARIRLIEGELRPGTRGELRQEDYEARAFDFHVTGDVQGSFEVTSDAAGPKGEGRASFTEFAIRRSAAEKPDLVGTGLTVVATTRDLQLARLATMQATARIDLGQARVPDLSTLAPLLPPSAGIALVGGHGTAGGGFDLELPAFAGRGALAIDLDDVAVRYGELDLHGRMKLDLALATAALPAGRFDLAGSSFSLTEFRIPQLAGGRTCGRAGAGRGVVGAHRAAGGGDRPAARSRRERPPARPSARLGAIHRAVRDAPPPAGMGRALPHRARPPGGVGLRLPLRGVHP